MGAFSNFLIQIRKEQGFKSALSFYEHLSERDGVTINYAQYKKIELGKTHPQPEFVRRLTKVLPQYSNQLVQSYCADQFPEHSSLFQIDPQLGIPNQNTPGLLMEAEELTAYQVSALAKTRTHYGLYLLLTLARVPLSREELASVFGIKPDSEIFQDFLDAQLAFETEGKIRARAIERVFPKSDTKALKKIYTQLDEWDLGLSEIFEMENLQFKSMVRRVSPRYVPILMKNAELLIEQFRASDETEASRNTEVVSLLLNIQRARLPG